MSCEVAIECPLDGAVADVSLFAHFGLDESLTDKLHTHIMQLAKIIILTCQSAHHFILQCAGATGMHVAITRDNVATGQRQITLFNHPLT